jgi:DNA polymerase sigma
MRQSKIADTVAIIAKARVPIIKFVTNEGKLVSLLDLKLADEKASSMSISRSIKSMESQRARLSISTWTSYPALVSSSWW